MGEPGFWDDQERAAKVSAEHARTSRRLSTYRDLERDVEDLEPLAELAEEDPEIEMANAGRLLKFQEPAG